MAEEYEETWIDKHQDAFMDDLKINDVNKWQYWLGEFEKRPEIKRPLGNFIYYVNWFRHPDQEGDPISVDCLKAVIGNRVNEIEDALWVEMLCTAMASGTGNLPLVEYILAIKPFLYANATEPLWLDVLAPYELKFPDYTPFEVLISALHLWTNEELDKLYSIVMKYGEPHAREVFIGRACLGVTTHESKFHRWALAHRLV